MGPFRERAKLGAEILRRPGLRHLSLDFLPDPHDLPGRFAVLSVVGLRGDVRHDFHVERPVKGSSGHR